VTHYRDRLRAGHNGNQEDEQVKPERPLRRVSNWSGDALSALCAVLAMTAAAPAAGGEASAAGETRAITVFAAASLTDAIGEIAREFTAGGGATGTDSATHAPVRTSFAASSVLARQIEAGAPAEVFISADVEWMDYLDARHLLRAGTRRALLGNRLVLIAPEASSVQVTLVPHVDLTAALGGGRLATGDPDSVPVGRYAQAALTRLGVWQQLAPQLVRAENVRAALEYVARGEATLGIVYRTDALAEKRVRIVATFPADSHPPIIYPVALTAGASPGAVAFEAFLASDAARAIFIHYGFEPPPLRTSRSDSP
jgi:molybdate transport system substrate-binding protein